MKQSLERDVYIIVFLSLSASFTEIIVFDPRIPLRVFDRRFELIIFSVMHSNNLERTAFVFGLNVRTKRSTENDVSFTQDSLFSFH